MKRKLAALALIYFVATAQVAAAASLPITRETQKDVMVTIYNGNLGLVKDMREVRLPTGINEVAFMDVAAQIDPTTVHLQSLTDPAGLRILEQNYEYDLVSSQQAPGEVRGPEGASLRQRRHLRRGDAAVDQRPGLRHQRPDPPRPSRPRRAARPARQPRVPAHARLAPAQPARTGRSGSRPRTSPAASPGGRTTSW